MWTTLSQRQYGLTQPLTYCIGAFSDRSDQLTWSIEPLALSADSFPWRHLIGVLLQISDKSRCNS